MRLPREYRVSWSNFTKLRISPWETNVPGSRLFVFRSWLIKRFDSSTFRHDDKDAKSFLDSFVKWICFYFESCFFFLLFFVFFFFLLFSFLFNDKGSLGKFWGKGEPVFIKENGLTFAIQESSEVTLEVNHIFLKMIYVVQVCLYFFSWRWKGI